MKSKIDMSGCSSCACMNLRKTSRAITQFYDRRLQPVGLRATQFTILVAVASRDMLTISELARYLVMDRTTLTRNLRPLVKREFIAVIPGEDQRKRCLTLLKPGKDVLEQALPLWRTAQQQIVKGLGTGNFNLLLAGLEDTIDITRET